MQARKYIVSGRVQGVGYRYWTQKEALKLGLKGYVKNLYNGDVEVYAIGPEKTLEKFREILKKGPPSSVVKNIEEFEMPIKNYISFEITF
ncbi:MAG TPA: acylphosphatase [Spirochaetota bacterium]|nr:acylphosphatase [Spirochaetota bacterium]HOL55994.1 acylphosphatase [Spirochaetota bacterium]HPP03436.1 acylphosphatase [Spirochaetota bacterium]